MQRLSMRPNRTKGKLITFCGLDGCGKTTMIRRLMAELEKEHQVFLTKQPTDFVRSSAIFRTYMDCPNHDVCSMGARSSNPRLRRDRLF